MDGEFVENLKNLAKKCLELKEESVHRLQFNSAAKYRDVLDFLKRAISKIEEQPNTKKEDIIPLDFKGKDGSKGTAIVREVFDIEDGCLAGCEISSGCISQKDTIFVFRGTELIHTGKIDLIKRYKNNIESINFSEPSNMKFGIKLKKYNDLKINDIIEAKEN